MHAYTQVDVVGGIGIGEGQYEGCLEGMAAGTKEGVEKHKGNGEECVYHPCKPLPHSGKGVSPDCGQPRQGDIVDRQRNNHPVRYDTETTQATTE